MIDNSIKRESGLWEVVVGLEVHAQVASRSKLFSPTPNEAGAEPNTNVSFLDLGFPGQLPVLNSDCVKKAIRTGLGVRGCVETCSIFDRKSYFYPDLSLGYQISQFFRPIVTGGEVEFFVFADNSYYIKNVALERIHLEQDAGKSVHDLFPQETALDFNRAGVGLMEVVSKPEISSAEEAMSFLRMLRCTLRCLGTCDGDMEKGNMRADVNISVRKKGDPLGTRVEIKNLNSIRYVGQVIQKESLRQIEVLERGGEVEQCTCLYNPKTSEINILRRKEDALDYRYFPDPDIPPLYLSEEEIRDEQEKMPELPIARIKRYCEAYGVSPYDANILVDDMAVSEFFEQALTHLSDVRLGRSLSLWIVGELFAKMSAEKTSIQESRVSPKVLVDIVNMVDKGVVSRLMAKELLEVVWETQENPEFVVKAKGWVQVDDESALEAWVKEVLEAHASEVEAYKNGKDKLKGFFVGQVMKKSQGKANPQKVNETLMRLLED